MAGLYGVGNDGEQYKGWTALPPGDAASAGPSPSPQGPQTNPGIRMTQAESDAANYLERHSGIDCHRILTDETAMMEAVKTARMRVHPDRVEGDAAKRTAHERFILVQRHEEVLKARFHK